MRTIRSAAAALFLILAGLVSARAQDTLWEGFEHGVSYWTVNALGNLTVPVQGINADFPTQGASGYRFRFDSPAPGGRAYFVTTQVGDLSGLAQVKIDVNNASPVLFKMYLVFKQGPRYLWHEAARIDVKPGWNRDLTVYINPATAPAGASTMTIQGLEDVREAALYFESHGTGGGNLYLDNLRAVGVDPAKILRATAVDNPTGTEVLVDGFEGGSAFTPDSAYSGATGAEALKSKDATQGEWVGKMTFKSSLPDDKGSYNLEANLDLSRVTGIRYDVYNPYPDDIDTTVAFNTGVDWEYFESVLKTLKPGWNRDVTYPVQSANYKCEKTGWRNSTSIRNLSQTRKILLYFLPHVIGEGHVFVDNVRLLTAEPEALKKQVAAVMPDFTPLTGKDVLLEGFEKDPVRFAADSAWSGAVSVVAREVSTTEGKRALRCDFDIPKDKNANYALETAMDLSKAEAVKVDIYHPGDTPLQAFVALNTGATYEWFESKPVVLKKGWNRDVTYRLNAPVFKSQASGWQFTVAPKNLAKTKKLYVGFFSNTAVKGSAYIDNVRVTGVAPQALGSGGGSARKLAGRSVVWDPLQTAARGWKPSSSAADNSFATVVYYEKVDGVRTAKLKYRTQTPSQQARFYKEEQLDWTSVLAVKMDVFNPQDYPVNLAMAFKTTQDFIWHESKEFMIPPGWTRDLTVDLASPQLKTARSNWTNSEYLNPRDDVREVSILVYPKRAGEGSLVVSNLRTLERDSLGHLGAPELGKVVGGSSKTVITARALNDDLVESFEGGVSAWQPTMKALVTGSDEYATDARRSLKVVYDTAGGESPAIRWSVPVERRDLSGYESMSFDAYNAGPPVQMSVAFKTLADDAWIEGPSLTLVTGWNRNVNLELFGHKFKSARTAWAVGESFRNAGQVDEIHVKFSAPPGRGTLYLDRLRFVGDGIPAATGVKPEFETDVTAMQSLSVKVNPSDFVQLKAEGNVVKTDGGPALASLAKASLDLRGFGNEFNLATGEVVTGTDDPLQLLSGTALGSNLISASERFYALDTSVHAIGFSHFGEKPHTFGTSSGYALRLNHVLFEDYVLGGGVVGGSFGMEPGANPLTARVESDVKTAHADLKGYVRQLNLALEGEVARSYYMSWIGGPLDLESSPQRDAYHMKGSVIVGPLKFQASRSEREKDFFAPFAQSVVTGAFQHNFEVSWQAETFGPVASLMKRGKAARDLLDDFNVFCQYYDYHQRADSYSNWSARVVARNNDTSRLHYFVWAWWFEEGKDVGDVSLTNPTLSTRILQTVWNPEFQYRLTDSLFARYLFRFAYTDYWEEMTHSAGLSRKFWGDTWLTGDGRFTRKAGSREGDFVNWSASLNKRMMGNTVEAALTFGASPFVGYWKEDASLKTVNAWSFTLGAKF